MSLDPFCDYLGVTVPEEEWYELRRELSPELDVIGMQVDYDQMKETLWRSPLGIEGTVKAKHIGGVRSIGVSGSVCAGLRLAQRFGAFLAAIAARPHRVTRLDASRDVPTDAPPALDRAVEEGRAGRVSLTRKSVRPRDVTTFMGVRADGRVSGTAYFGTANADVRLCMYDKQHERMQKGMPDNGPLTRYELRIKSGAGVTLRDAYEPREVFWHFMPQCIDDGRPSDLKGWVANGTGFEFERPAPVDPAIRLMRRVQDSAEVVALVRLAAEVGPGGFDLLVSQMRRLSEAPPSPMSRVWAQPTETAPASP